MADYLAVLKRTLSGFSDPPPELRGKLYVRARTTIRRQLEGRQPALDEARMASEMDRLEEAILAIERDYDPTGRDGVLGTAEETAPPSPPPAPAVAPVSAMPPEPEGVPPVVEPLPAVEPPLDEMPSDEAVTEEAPTPLAMPPEHVVVATSAPREPDDAGPDRGGPDRGGPGRGGPDRGGNAFSVAAVAQAGVASAGTAAVMAPVAPVPEGVQVRAPESPQVAAEAPQPAPLPATSDEPEPASPVPDDGDLAVPPAAEIGVAQRATAFSAPQGEGEAVAPDAPRADVPPPAPLPVDAFSSEPTDVDALLRQLEAEESVAATAGPVAGGGRDVPQTAYREPSVAAASVEDGDDLASPTGFTPRTVRRRSPMRWLLLAIVLIVLGALAALAWFQREVLIDRLGLSELLNQGGRPTPVRTITIRPPGEESDRPADENVVAPEPVEPKQEERLGANGAPAAPETTLPPTATPEPASTPSAPPPGAQTAILYEEGGSGTQDAADAGSVVWSVVQESPGDGLDPEPAIRARVEVPERDVVLLMTIKRNGDRALPATHLIELVFATPDDFEGGAVQEINRYVLKESEQGRGEPLAGVPARIADGIFMIALDNLDAARERNVTLLKGRDWIDIPLLYRTGRRALMTLEKGEAGKAVFDEVFAAWESAGR